MRGSGKRRTRRLSDPEKLHVLPRIDRPLEPRRHLTLPVPGQPLIISQTTCSAGSRRRRRLAVPVARTACSTLSKSAQQLIAHLSIADAPASAR